MNIAIMGIKGVPGHHGVEVVVDSLVPHLVSLGHEMTVYGYEGYTEPSDDYFGARILTVAGSERKNLEMISHMWNAALDARRRRYDIVHIHSTDPCLLAWLPRPRHGIVATSHGQAYLRKKWGLAAKTVSKLAERMFIHYPEAVTCVSKPLCDYYRLRFGRDVEYIPNGITFRDAPSADWLRKWNLEPGRYLFSSAGRVERTKGLTTLIQAYRRLGTDLPLVIAGGGSATDDTYFEELKTQKPEGVSFVGFLTGDEYYALYAHARLFIFPSEYEAMSMTLLEGLSFGVPTIYSDTPENEAVAKGLGISFRVSDTDSLAGCISHVLANMTEAQALGRKARQTVRLNHEWPVIARQYHEIYLKVASRS
ncbi:MAG: glycosyltransferase family 4 protein [Candidatus Krumholzibacteria bacterium]|nr:glycosyltransferase family 4 protein [Candidatus Krumholzibacteria bacterium]